MNAVHAVAQRPGDLDRDDERFGARIGGAAEPIDQRVGDAHADDFARQELGVSHALERGDAREHRQPGRLQPRQLSVERLEVEHRRRHDELRAGLDLVREPAPFAVRLGANGLTATPM